MRRAVLRYPPALLLALVALLTAGCATTESDMPWNAPQPWEGSPLIPGLPSYE
jgi:hypothetical protein